MPKTEPFDNYSDEYDNWFILNKYAFLSELNAVKRALPPKENIIEIGIGSGIFAEPLGIKEGVEPSAAMRNKASKKGIKVIDAAGEELPYSDKSKNAVLMVTTICFVDDVYKSFQEVYRVLKDDGHFIIGFVDKESPIGKLYLKEKDRSLFYKKATFFGTEELFEILKDTGFEVVNTFQTIFGRIDEIVSEQKTLAGYGQGSFIVIKAQKNYNYKFKIGEKIMLKEVTKILGNEAEDLLQHKCIVSKENLHLPNNNFIDEILSQSDRPIPVLRNLQTIYNHGRLANTGYLSILPVDQGVEHSAGASFAPNPMYFDPENIVRLAINGGCNAVVSTLGVLGSVARKYAHKIPFIVKLNHNELLTYPESYDQILFADVDQAFNMGAFGIGATIFFGSENSDRQIQEISKVFKYAHQLGLVTVLWAYLRNSAFKTKEADYHLSADLTGQANHLGVTIEADIIKQKQPVNNEGYLSVNFGRTNEKVYSELTTNHPIDLTRYQVMNCYMGRVGLINSGGASSGKNDLQEIIKTAVINKRAGGMGLISGRKVFQKPMDTGIDILHKIQDVYLCDEISIA